MNENDETPEKIEIDGQDVPVVEDATKFIEGMALAAPPHELIPLGLALINTGSQAVIGAAGTRFGQLAVTDSLLKGFLLMEPELRSAIAKMGVLAVAMTSPDDAPEEFKSPEGYARFIADSFEELEVDFEAAREKWVETKDQLDAFDDLESAFSLPDAERPEGGQ
jgi:hypothetical protein